MRRVEAFFDPQAHTDRGVDFVTAMTGFGRAIEAESDESFSMTLILCFLRHLSEKEAFETLEMAEPYRDQIIGVGLDSSEVGNPPSKIQASL